MTKGRTELHIVERSSVTSRKYVKVVLEPQIRQFSRGFANARPNQTYVISEYSQTEDITRK